MIKELKKEISNLEYLLNNKPKTIKSNDSKSRRSLSQFSNTDYYNNSLNYSIKKIRSTIYDISPFLNDDNRDAMIKIIGIIMNDDFISRLDELRRLSDSIVEENGLSITFPDVPTDIKSNIYADIKEVEKSFNNGCFRAAVILCGRILEVCLHRKYYDATGIDILEKNPGIGLGKLIAKLSDKNVPLDPGITQQIHLVNQIRVHSVHVKKESFYPTKQQTYAMILYTLDIINKMF